MGEIGDFEDGEFYGFRTDCEQKDKIQERPDKEIESNEFITPTYREEPKHGEKRMGNRMGTNAN